MPEKYPTIHEALEAASPGDSIIVSGYQGITTTALMNTDRVSLIGSGPDATIAWISPTHSASIEVSANFCHIASLAMWHGYAYDVNVYIGSSGTNTSIEGLRFSESGVGVQTIASNARITNCIFSDIERPIHAYGNGATIVEECEFRDCGGGIDTWTPVTARRNRFLRGRPGTDFGANDKGLGLYAYGVDGPVRVEDNLFYDNWATGYSGEPPSSEGGAIWIGYCDDVTIHGNVIEANQATIGAGIYAVNSHIEVAHNVVSHNYDASNYPENPEAGAASALFALGCSGSFENNTVVANTASDPGVLAFEYSTLSVAGNIVTSNASSGAAIVCVNGSVPLSCNNVWSNFVDDYDAACGAETGTDGNIATDPLFCDADAGRYELYEWSPCAPENSPPGCGLIGALGVGCGISAVFGNGEVDDHPQIQVQPNPARGPVSIVVDLRTAARTSSRTLSVHDVSGRLVREWNMDDGAFAPQDFASISWNHTDATGRRLPAGAYYLSMRVSERSEGVLIVLLE